MLITATEELLVQLTQGICGGLKVGNNVNDKIDVSRSNAIYYEYLTYFMKESLFGAPQYSTLHFFISCQQNCVSTPPIHLLK